MNHHGIRSMPACRPVLGLMLAALAHPVHAGAIFVDVDAPPGGDGTSWAQAYDDLSLALIEPGQANEIWVAEGRYTPGPERTSAFTLERGVAVYGGFAGDETMRSQRDWATHVTRLSGDILGDDGPGFEGNAENCYHVVEADGETGSVALDGFRVVGGNANGTEQGADQWYGGGLIVWGGSAAVRNCTFRESRADVAGGGVYAGHPETLLIVTDTVFLGNVADAGGGGALCSVNDMVFEGCAFRGNSSGIAGGGGLVAEAWSSARLDRCVFAENATTGPGGGAAFGSGLDLVNCLFSRNQASFGGGFIGTSAPTSIVNCTFALNEGGGLYSYSRHTIGNTIIWGNTPDQIDGPTPPYILHSDVEGGWPGPGEDNIDADPLFVQPGAHDMRLGIGSPAVNVGDNDLIPVGVVLDLAGNPRIVDGIVDMGAYEGEFESLPRFAFEEDLDVGEVAFLIPSGGEIDLEQNVVVIFRNVSGPNDATVSLTEYPYELHPGAGGFRSLGADLRLETSLADGEFFATVYMPYGVHELGGQPPLEMDLTFFAQSVENWGLAVVRNTVDSPGHGRPIGDRIVEEGPTGQGATADLGDYGVFRNTDTDRGFVWANLDHAADMAFGTPFCPADAQQPPDGLIDFGDVTAVLEAWGLGPGPFDVNNDGLVDFFDIIGVLTGWGTCG